MLASSPRGRSRVDTSTQRPLVLLVDDEPHNLAAMERALRADFAVETFDSAVRALVCALERRPAVVVTDLRMSAMTGIALLRQLRLTGIPSVGVLVTAYADSDDVRLSAEEELHTFSLRKPWQPQELLALV